MLNRTQYPSDVIALVVLWRLRYKLSLRDLPEMFAIRGIVFSYEAVRDWEAKLTPALAENLRRRRRGKVGRTCTGATARGGSMKRRYRRRIQAAAARAAKRVTRVLARGRPFSQCTTRETLIAAAVQTC